MTAIIHNLVESSVAAQAAAIASGELTPSALLETYLERIDRLEPSIEAFAYLDREGARSTAERLTEEAKRGALRGPLRGVPVAIKDQLFVRSMPNLIGQTWGDDSIPEVDAGLVRALRESGAIIIGTTYMPDRHGDPATRNPWNLAHAPGGSSSGSAASAAARMVSVAIGEQTGGSNIRPAAFCGLAGMRPTYGRFSRAGMYAISWSLDQAGIIARSMEDVAIVYSAGARYDAADPSSIDAPVSAWPAKLEPHRPPRIGVVRNLFTDHAEADMLAAIDRASEQFKSAGADVTDVALPESFAAIWPAWKVIAAAERTTFHAKHAAALEAAGVQLKPDADGWVPSSYYLQAQRIRRSIRDAVTPLFDGLDAMLTPAAPGAAPEGNGPGNNVMNSPWASVGFPVITINGGLNAQGLPLGLQLSAPRLADESLIQAGYWCESVLGRLPAPPNS
ncbi:MAG: amidase [Dehalococcoidia bacterium]|nr:amidase [Dehalococcoidia bacterium]